MRVQKSITAQNQWSNKFTLVGDDGAIGIRRALISIVQGTADSTVSIRRYDPADGTTVISVTKTTKSSAVEVPVEGVYDFGVATGDFGTGACLVTVEQ